MKMRKLAKGGAILAAAIAFLAVVGLVVMGLWNWLVPALFAGPQIGYLQALGLLVLARLLFGGWRGRGWHGHWRQRMWRERWESLTPEERARLRERYTQGRCHGWREPAANVPEQPRAAT
ncbi:MAG TPA: hypothetical protein VH109_11910 [Steroidobacteraceae bacterium]|jgi:hypothetical protein|nr:hypothetical protein [Steroidobacteraceae bacterium]